MIAIIPARGGSKGLPGKNIKMLCGKPLISHTIDCARQSRSIDRVIVSTDDESIADVALRAGAEVPFLRPASLAGDSSMAIDTYLYTIDRLAREEKKAFENLVVLLPTTPLRTSEDVDGAVKLFIDRQADSVISYTPEAHPVKWHKYLDENNSFVNIFDDTIDNRQTQRISYYPNGAIYVFKTLLLRTRMYYTDKSFAYVMPRNRSVDIDSMEDFLYAEFLLNLRNNSIS